MLSSLITAVVLGRPRPGRSGSPRRRTPGSEALLRLPFVVRMLTGVVRSGPATSVARSGTTEVSLVRKVRVTLRSIAVAWSAVWTSKSCLAPRGSATIAISRRRGRHKLHVISSSPSFAANKFWHGHALIHGSFFQASDFMITHGFVSIQNFSHEESRTKTFSFKRSELLPAGRRSRILDLKLKRSFTIHNERCSRKGLTSERKFPTRNSKTSSKAKSSPEKAFLAKPWYSWYFVSSCGVYEALRSIVRTLR